MRGTKRCECAIGLLSYRGLGKNEKKCLYERVIVQTALYGAEAWGIRSDREGKCMFLKLSFFRRLVRVSRMDRVRNEEVRRRAGIETQLASRVDQIILKWFGHVERMDNC